MRVKLICDCGSTFTLSERVKFRKGDILCPNCGMVLPSGATESIKNFFVSYQKLCESLSCEKDHIVTLKALKLSKDSE